MRKRNLNPSTFHKDDEEEDDDGCDQCKDPGVDQDTDKVCWQSGLRKIHPPGKQPYRNISTRFGYPAKQPCYDLLGDAGNDEEPNT